MERVFGTANTTFVYNLKANTQSTRNIRKVTKTVNPKHHANWTLERLTTRLAEWIVQYETADHIALGQSPLETFTAGLDRAGHRLHRIIPYDEDFVIFTLPTTRKGTAKVQPNQGVKINYIYYSCHAFRDPEVEGSQVQVRYDPFDAGVAYAFVKNRWVKCMSDNYMTFKGRSERELMQAAAEIRKQNQEHTSKSPVTGQKLAAFLATLEAEEALHEQRGRDSEIKAVHTKLRVQDASPSALALTVHDTASRLTRQDDIRGSQEMDEDTPTRADNLPIYSDF